eukprot:NODE_365_length_8707_cov_1.170423.p7 type:complete len:141 gc:universal NODE_365_length_8707_cov_1.170423:70-492(+)
MGELALEQLHFFVTMRTEDAKTMLTASHHPIYWFSMALVCINVSSFVVELLNTRRLHPYMYISYLELCRPPGKNRNCLSYKDLLPIKYIHLFYCQICMEFVERWQLNNTTVIQFEMFFKEFKIKIEQELILSYMKYLIKT